MKIYLASSWRNTAQPSVLKTLRAAGHEVYDFRNPEPGVTGFAWEEVDKNWKNWGPVEMRDALNHPVAVRGFKRDFTAMCEAEVCVLLLPSGRSAHLEAGYMAGSGARVLVLASILPEPELMYGLCDGIFSTTEELLQALARIEAKQ